MATFAIAAAVLVLGTYVLLGAITVCSFLRKRPDPYPPEAAEAPTALDEHFKTAPREQRIDRAEVDRLVEQFDWPRYATWLKEPS
jgi:hypothetical protein